MLPATAPPRFPTTSATGPVAGRGDDYVCAEGFGVGLIPALIKRRAKQKKVDGPEDIRRGRLALREIVAAAEPLDIQVEIDGEPQQGDLLSVEVLTGPFTGPALPLAHDADPSNKLLDIVCVDTKKADAFAAWIEAPQDKRPPVISRQGKKIKIGWRDAASRIDDEVIAVDSAWQDVTISCEAKPLRILMPVPHPAVHKNPKHGARPPKFLMSPIGGVSQERRPLPTGPDCPRARWGR